MRLLSWIRFLRCLIEFSARNDLSVLGHDQNTSTMANLTTNREYSRLREKVKNTLLLGRQQIEEAKVRTYWETGRLVDRYVEQHTPSGKERAVYNKQIVERLSRDLGIDETTLYRSVLFAQQFKKVARGPLSWSHYRILIAVDQPEKRKEFADLAVRQNLSAERLSQEVKRYRALSGGRKEARAGELLLPKKGQPYTYRLVNYEKIHTGRPDLRVDLGFACYKEASMKGAAQFKAGDIVTSQWIADDAYKLGAVSSSSPPAEALLFTYYAYIEKVVDGDTLRVQVDLGFGQWTRQYLRLRGIDAPELVTAEGKRAKRFVEFELSAAPYVIITSTRSDKYDRYLADVFYKSASGSGEQFLNNRLLEESLARRV